LEKLNLFKKIQIFQKNQFKKQNVSKLFENCLETFSKIVEKKIFQVEN